MKEAKKKCSDCRKMKPLSEFHKNRTRKDGYQHTCKKCKNERGRDYQSGYRRIKVYGTEEHRARNRVQSYVVTGKLPHVSILKCSICGNQASERHHLDYENDVLVDLCSSCHGIAHSKDVSTEFLQLLQEKSYSLKEVN